jgi:hydrogenase expression/formation protein HypE
MAARAGLSFDTPLLSDCQPLWPDVEALLTENVTLHCLRDLTRGGLAAALVELAETANLGIDIDAAAIPVSGTVRSACELLGLDPLHVANEGRFIAVVPDGEADLALSVMAQRGEAAIIGHIGEEQSGSVVVKSPFGPRRRLHLPSGEQLPRIC